MVATTSKRLITQSRTLERVILRRTWCQLNRSLGSADTVIRGAAALALVRLAPAIVETTEDIDELVDVLSAAADTDHPQIDDLLIDLAVLVRRAVRLPQ